MTKVTQILFRIDRGDPQAAEQLLPIVYEELRKLASAKLANEKPGQTLQATALVHDAYLRLIGVEDQPEWNSRGHFFGAAAEAMRRILIEAARRKSSQKAGGEFDRITLAESALVEGETPEDLLTLDEALQKLEEQSPRKAEVVKLRYFAGLTVPETAVVLGIANSTVIADWSYAKGWLKLEISRNL